MTVLAVLAVLESTLPSSCFSYKIQYQEAAVTVLAVSAVVAVSVVTATPLKLNPLFRDPDDSVKERGTLKVQIQTPQIQPGRLMFIHHRCWEVLPFCLFQRQRCIKIRVLRAQDFYTPLALKTAKGQHLPALVVSKNQSPTTTLLSALSYRHPVDPVVGDPVRQDNDKMLILGSFVPSLCVL